MGMNAHAGAYCKRTACGKRREASAAKFYPYCSHLCQTVSRSAHGHKLPPLPEWTWLAPAPQDDAGFEEAS